ncbi:hypothetical protein RDI58_015483 [Solanum bulbocastanum]|uniref:Uncharacterized protein n=1 Tax=Solanum bulbocastanum TaxID=147425 RepID=A0AAN8YF14_SOLBU
MRVTFSLRFMQLSIRRKTTHGST